MAPREERLATIPVYTRFAGGRKALTRARLQEGLDLLHLLWTEPEVRGADHALHLLRRAHADDGRRHRRMAQRPRDGHYARRAAVALADGAQQFGQLQIAGEPRLTCNLELAELQRSEE